jgi:hypothetical protein
MDQEVWNQVHSYNGVNFELQELLSIKREESGSMDSCIFIFSISLMYTSTLLRLVLRYPQLDVCV